MSEIQVLYRMPAAGQLEVWATLEDRDTRLHGALLNESGCSDGYVRQITRGYFWSSGCEQQYRNIRDKAVESNGKDVSWTDELSGYGDLSLIHLKSTATYRQGELVTAAIGVRDDTSFRVDDMAVDPSKITSSYIVREILLRSTGAP